MHYGFYSLPVLLLTNVHLVPELLEYMSLIRYASKYYKRLEWCVYDTRFFQKAASNKSLKWSAIDI